MKLLGITGYKQSGKSTLARQAKIEFGFRRMGFAFPLKELIGNLWPDFTWENIHGDAKEEVLEVYGKSFREVAQAVGTDLLRTYDPDVWVRATRKVIELYQYQMGDAARDLVLDDVRFDNEAALIHELGGQVWEVVRPEPELENGGDVYRKMRKAFKRDPHVSEKGLLVASIDMVILNAFGLDEYIAMCSRKVKEFVDG